MNLERWIVNDVTFVYFGRIIIDIWNLKAFNKSTSSKSFALLLFKLILEFHFFAPLRSQTLFLRSIQNFAPLTRYKEHKSFARNLRRRRKRRREKSMERRLERSLLENLWRHRTKSAREGMKKSVAKIRHEKKIGKRFENDFKN